MSQAMGGWIEGLTNMPESGLVRGHLSTGKMYLYAVYCQRTICSIGLIEPKQMDP